ncbi:MAG: phage terminase small subunit P27 family [Lachnospiraceae bacterium]|jgi:P27 family predicted phage terminase small subunit|nr:phage terminase small subunit P27 family [Lachnospiraceae bacterium]
MAGQRQPIDLLKAKGKKHLTKAEIEERERTEIKAPADKVTAPAYLTPEQKKKFKKIVKDLRAVNLVSNLDVDALARLVIAQEKYIAVTQELEKQPLMIEIEVTTDRKDEFGKPIMCIREVVNGNLERLALLQDRYFRQCRQGAADFGLTVSSRCRLVVPKPESGKEEANKFKKFAS